MSCIYSVGHELEDSDMNNARPIKCLRRQPDLNYALGSSFWGTMKID